MIETVKQSKDSKRKLPNGWRRVRLGEVCRIQNGFAFDSDKFDAAVGVPLIRIRDLKTNNPSIRYSGDFDEVYLVRAGDLLIGMDGEFRAYRWQGLDALLNQRVCRLFHDMNQVAIGYIHYLLDEYLQDIEEVTTFTTVKHLSSRDIEAISIPLPPLTEQRRIADVLHEQMKAVDKARAAAMSRLEAVKALTATFLREVFPQPGQPLPNGWRWVKLGNVIEVVSGQVNPTESCYRDLPHVNGENIESGTGQLLTIRSAAEDHMTSGKYLFEAGVVLYSKLRPYLKKAAIADFRGLCSADMYPILPNHDELTSLFLLQILLSEPFTIYAESQSQRARMPKLNRNQLLAYSAILPPLVEQQRIAGRLREQMAVVEKARTAAEAELNMINALPAALLRRAFNGEI